MKTRRQAFMALLISEQLDPRVDQQWINMAAVPVHRSPTAMGYHIVKDWFSETASNTVGQDWWRRRVSFWSGKRTFTSLVRCFFSHFFVNINLKIYCYYLILIYLQVCCSMSFEHRRSFSPDTKHI